MYCLIRFVDDGIYYVTPKKGLTSIDGDLVWAPYKRLGYYEAKVVNTNINRQVLLEEKKIIESEQDKDIFCSTMYCLIRFVDDGIYYVTPEKGLTSIDGDLVWAPYKRLGYYKAKVVNTNINRQVLLEEKQIIESEQDKNLQINDKEMGFLKGLPTTFNEKNEWNELGSFTFENQVESEDLEISIKEVASKEKNDWEELGSSNFEKPIESEGFNDNDKNSKYLNEGGSNKINCNLAKSSPINSGGNVEFKGTNQNGKYKSTHKRHACYFCGRKIFQISRHLLSSHSEETEIKEIKRINPRNSVRMKKLELLRKRGDFKSNTLMDNNGNIVIRQSSKIVEGGKGPKYVPCPSCFGFIVKDNLRHHKSRCSPHKGDRKLQGNALKLLHQIHSSACETLREVITPYMFQDEIAKTILYDEIIILFGNFLCVKYTRKHLNNHVRAQLRLLGRLMLRAKVYKTSITSFKNLMQSVNCDIIRKGIDFVAGLDSVRGIYEHPYNARALNTALQKIVEVMKSEYIKREDHEQLKNCEAFLQVYKIDVAPYLNRICSLSEKKQRRIKQSHVELPENDEVQTYLKYLIDCAKAYYRRLEIKFSFDDWKNLSQYLLVALAVFNRKRPGEIQRLEVDDFCRRQGITQKELNNLEEDDQLQADKYVRVGFGGKLGNATALLIDKEKILPGLLLMLSYRLKAGVHPKNPFVFGAPSSDDTKTYSTYTSHQQFLAKSGMKGSNLSFTNLRYHLATQVSKQGTTQEEELRVSNYMSHDYRIHKNIYDQSSIMMDITKVSKHLEASASVGNKKQRHTKDTKKERMQKSKILANQEWEEESGKDFNGNCSLDSEPDEILVEQCLGKFQQRNAWTSTEKKITREYFAEELSNGGALNSVKVRMFKDKYSHVLKNRSPAMIKQWLQKEISKTLGIRDIRPRYSTPERECLESSTEKYSLSGSEPSLQELEELIIKNPILRRRSATSLLTKYKNLRKMSV